MEASTSLTLIVMSGPSAGASYALEGVAGHIVMGSDPSANIQFEGAAVAAKHAMIVIDENGVAVQPADPDVPLYVNDDSILGPTVINDGDILWMGNPGDDGAVMLQCQLGPARDLTQDVDEPLDQPETQPEEAAEPESEDSGFYAPEESAEDEYAMDEAPAVEAGDDDDFVTPEFVSDGEPFPEAVSEEAIGFAPEAPATESVFEAEPEPEGAGALDTDEHTAFAAGAEGEALAGDEAFVEEPAFEPEPEAEALDPEAVEDAAVEDTEVVDTAEYEPFVEPEDAAAQDDDFYEPEPVPDAASEDAPETMAYTDASEAGDGDEAEFIEPEEDSPFLSNEAEPGFTQTEEPDEETAVVEDTAVEYAAVEYAAVEYTEAIVSDEAPAFIDDAEPEEESPFQSEELPATTAFAASPAAAAGFEAGIEETVVDDGTSADPIEEPEETQVLHGYEPIGPETATPPAAVSRAEPRGTDTQPPAPQPPAPQPPAPQPPAPPPPPAARAADASRPAARPRAAAAPARPARRPPAPRPAARPRAAAAGRPVRKSGSSPTGLYLGIGAIVIIAAGAGAFFMAKGGGGGAETPPPTTMGGITPPTTLSAGGGDALPDPGALPEPGLPPLEPLETPAPDAATLDPTPDPALTATPEVETSDVPPVEPVATPEPTPTPRATPTPRPTPTPGPSGPTPEQIKAQQIAQLMSQADTAAAAGQFDNAARIYGEVLALDPNHAQARSGRATTAATAAALRKSFAAGRTAYASPSKGGGPAGFDTAAVADPNYLGEVVFEASPSRVKGGDAYSVKIYLRATGKKNIKIASLDVTASGNENPQRSAPSPRSKQVASGQRILVHEHAGAWDAATQSWYLEVVVTSDRGDTYRSRLTWK